MAPVVEPVRWSGPCIHRLGGVRYAKRSGSFKQVGFEDFYMQYF